MKFNLDDRVLGFLREQGASDVTVDLEDLPTPCCLGRVPEMKISLQTPANHNAYRHFSVHGIGIHLSKLLRTKDTLKLFLSGIGPFKKVEVSGVKLIL
ncbi:MAG: hypothetical protein ACE5ER_08590 [Nitrospinaceae bacterium]